MVEKNNRLVGLWILVAAILVGELYYWYPVYTGTWHDMESLFEFSTWGLWIWINIILSIVLVISVTYGFYKRKNWARIYTIAYCCYSGFWAIVSMFFWRWEITQHYLFFVLYVLVMVYLLISHVKSHFCGDDFPSFAESHVYRYGDYTLYKQETKLKSGGARTRYFFCKNPSDKGKPCSKPDEYSVGINKRNGMPYLKKKR